MTGPLIALAIPSVVIGWLTIGPVLFGDFFDDSIFVLRGARTRCDEVGAEFHGPGQFVLHAFTSSAASISRPPARSSRGSSTSSGRICRAS